MTGYLFLHFTDQQIFIMVYVDFTLFWTSFYTNGLFSFKNDGEIPLITNNIFLICTHSFCPRGPHF